MANWIDRIIYPAPTEDRIYLEREVVPDETCSECGSDDVRRYPIADQHGPRMATKCQACLHILAVERPGPNDAWPPFRAVAYDWEASLAERASSLLSGGQPAQEK